MNSERPFTYLACPYTFKAARTAYEERETRLRRFEQVTLAATVLIVTKHWNVFSPITHSHPMHETGHLAGDWGFWETIDRDYINHSCRIVTLVIPGWQESTGVRAENVIAREQKIEQLFMSLPERVVPTDAEGSVLTQLRPGWRFKLSHFPSDLTSEPLDNLFVA